MLIGHVTFFFDCAGLGTVNIRTWKSSSLLRYQKTPSFQARKKCKNGQKDAAKKTRKPFWHFRGFALTLRFRMFSCFWVFVFSRFLVFVFLFFLILRFITFAFSCFRVFAFLLVIFVLWDMINMNEVLPGKLRYITRRRGGA